MSSFWTFGSRSSNIVSVKSLRNAASSPAANLLRLPPGMCSSNCWRMSPGNLLVDALQPLDQQLTLYSRSTFCQIHR